MNFNLDKHFKQSQWQGASTSQATFRPKRSVSADAVNTSKKRQAFDLEPKEMPIKLSNLENLRCRPSRRTWTERRQFDRTLGPRPVVSKTMEDAPTKNLPRPKTRRSLIKSFEAAIEREEPVKLEVLQYDPTAMLSKTLASIDISQPMDIDEGE